MFGITDVSVLAAAAGILVLVIALEWAHRRSARLPRVSCDPGRVNRPGEADHRRMAADLRVIAQAAASGRADRAVGIDGPAESTAPFPVHCASVS